MYEIYNVKNGDTIESISKMYNILPSTLYKINGFNKDYVLKVGNNIIVPKTRNNYFDYYTVQKGDTIFMGNNEY